MFVYAVPDIPILLTTFIFPVVSSQTGLLRSLALGIVFGPEVSNIIPEYVLQTLLVFGYIGLIFLVFEAGMSTNLALVYHNIPSSILVGGTGVLHIQQGFAAGASLSSTSLGTTLALLKPELRQTKTGITLSSSASAQVSWQDIVRPIMVSVAFVVITSLSLWALRTLAKRMPDHWKRFVYQAKVQLFLLVTFIAGFVAGANYAGTSELFGAYLAGVLVAHIFHAPPEATGEQLTQSAQIAPTSDSHVSLTLVSTGAGFYTPHLTFTIFIEPILECVLSPIFFASIRSTLPIRTLVNVKRSSKVVWRGFQCKQSSVHIPYEEQSTPQMSQMRSSIFLGLAIIARGEIALIVSQIARPILMRVSQELYAIVIWAILLDTIIGALGVGVILRQDSEAKMLG
ncbi:sodium-hydrogen antiporter [Lentinula detonsa]|uniref:Sodium-hydrogen antiporter n=1 Tax=Lentinula detonsa TaxID=2804962 RepID=A0AA38UYU6_9AGAR|nr:sodium-hydrogen antiporter [Lentinula detonsa]